MASYLADERLRASDKSKAVVEDGRLAAASQDGEIRDLAQDDAGEPEIISSRSVIFLAVLKDGRLAAGGFDGNITLLRMDQATVRNGKPLVLGDTDNRYGRYQRKGSVSTGGAGGRAPSQWRRL